MKKQLSAQAVERTKPPKTGRLEIDDLVVPGLVLRVTDKGVKSWSLLYRVAGEGGLTTTGLPKRGKLRRITLGRYPVLDLKGARDAARRALALADTQPLTLGFPCRQRLLGALGDQRTLLLGQGGVNMQ